jgi:PTH1 family peptidyl-tRNA hydrolase
VPEKKHAPTFDALVVGLGNPGKQYARTRHNVGEEVVAELARRHGTTLSAGRDSALEGQIRLGSPPNTKRAVLAFPTTFMNESGNAVAKLVRRHGFVIDGGFPALVVVHDELDLSPGTVRVKFGGGLGGHNGLRSITDRTGTQDYVRVRIGVGKPTSKEQGANHVLSRVPPAEREILDVAVRVAADAVEKIVVDGVDAAMNTYNSL